MSPLCYPYPTGSFQQLVLVLVFLFDCHCFPPGTPFPAQIHWANSLGEVE